MEVLYHLEDYFLVPQLTQLLQEGQRCHQVASLTLNVVILAPLSVSLYLDLSLAKAPRRRLVGGARVEAWYGEQSVARSIVASTYVLLGAYF